MEDTTYDYEHLLVPKKDPLPVKGIIIAVVIMVAIVTGYFVYDWLAPNDIVEFQNIYEVEVLDIPYGVTGTVLNTCGENISVSDISLVIDGKVIESKKTYPLENVARDLSSDTIPPGESVEFTFPLPGFLDRLLVTSGDKLSYNVKLYHDGVLNDKEEFDVSHLYD